MGILGIILTGCTPKKNDSQQQNQTGNVITIVQNDYSKILNGDLSEFAGYWVNGIGEKIQLRADGTLVRANGTFIAGNKAVEFRCQTNEYLASGGEIYMWDIDSDEMGYYVAFYPVGVDIKAYDGIVSSDNTKVRLTADYDLFSSIGAGNVFYRDGGSQISDTVSDGNNIVNRPGEIWGFLGGMGGHMGGNSGYIFNSNDTFQRLGGTFGEDSWELRGSGRYTIRGSSITFIYDGDQWSDDMYHFSISGNTLMLGDFSFTIMKTADINIREKLFDYSKILNGDLSEFADIWWVTHSGLRMQLKTNDGTLAEGDFINNFTQNEDGHFYWNVGHYNAITQDGWSFGVFLYPPGVEIRTRDHTGGIITIPSDTTKVRMGTGMEPPGEDGIYYLYTANGTPATAWEG